MSTFFPTAALKNAREERTMVPLSVIMTDILIKRKGNLQTTNILMIVGQGINVPMLELIKPFSKSSRCLVLFSPKKT